jgi:transcription antitermination factor NusG
MTLTGAQLYETPEPLWFCLKTQAKREHIAAAALRQIPGLDVLAPRIRFRKATRRGPVWFMEAMFPGYVFAQFLYAAQHRQVQHVPGITRVVGFGDRVGIIDFHVVEQIRRAAGEEEVIVYSPELQVGDAVQIAEGAFQGLEAVITQLVPARERVKVLLEFLGREVQAEIALPSLLSTAAPRSRFARE